MSLHLRISALVPLCLNLASSNVAASATNTDTSCDDKYAFLLLFTLILSLVLALGLEPKLERF